MKHLLFISFLFLGFSLNAQTTSTNDTLAKYTFDELSEKFYAAKPDSLRAILYATYYINKAKLEKDTMQIADGYYFLSEITNNAEYFLKYWNDIIFQVLQFLLLAMISFLSIFGLLVSIRS